MIAVIAGIVQFQRSHTSFHPFIRFLSYHKLYRQILFRRAKYESFLRKRKRSGLLATAISRIFNIRLGNRRDRIFKIQMERMKQQVNNKTVFYNGHIWTGDQNYPEAEAMVVEHGRIAAIGTNRELINQVIGCEKIDLAGARVIPGLHDSHQHLVNVGRMMDWVNLNGSASRAEVVARCQAYAEANPARSIITGRGFLHDSFDDRAMPTRYDLDQVSENKPVVIVRACGHIAVVNSAMLRLAGIGHGYQFGSDGQVDLDANGEPLGIFRESAIALISSFYPKDTTADVQRYISNAARAVTASGLTSVQTNDVGNTGNEGWL